jgi:hypothetical protein
MNAASANFIASGESLAHAVSGVTRAIAVGPAYKAHAVSRVEEAILAVDIRADRAKSPLPCAYLPANSYRSVARMSDHVPLRTSDESGLQHRVSPDANVLRDLKTVVRFNSRKKIGPHRKGAGRQRLGRDWIPPQCNPSLFLF